MEITSPTSRRSPFTKIWSSPISMPSAPQTAGLPQPLATTAAWLASPPLVVRIPTATCIPWTSAGEVSWRTRMTSSVAIIASSAVRTILPTAAPGDAPSPVVRTSLAGPSKLSCKSRSSWSVDTRINASSWEIVALGPVASATLSLIAFAASIDDSGEFIE